ncbi:MAG: T9SS type A sorting domain-containing protein [Flavobacteriales bacterium]|nr:T9SS type A sorting domain-containing protein [Flavobacteriales bacterium]
MKEIVATLVLVCSLNLFTKGQYINLHFIDATTESYALVDVSSIKFEGNEMRMRLLNTAVLSWNTSLFEYIDYDVSTASISNNSPSAIISFNVFPNPSSNSVTIEIESNFSNEAVVEISDLSGLIYRYLKGKFVSEKLVLLWDGTDSSGKRVVPGLYLCTVQSGNHLVARTIIITN